MEKDKTRATEYEAPERKMSKGEKLFDALVYGGLGYLMTFIVTVPIAWKLQFGKNIAPKFDKAATWFDNTFKVGHDGAQKFLQTTTLFIGGFVPLPFIWVAEKFKQPMVNTFNRWMNDPTDPSKIKEAPKQTVSSLLWGRVVAWLTVFVSLFCGGMLFSRSFATFEREFATKLTNAQKRPIYKDTLPPGLLAEYHTKRAALDVATTEGMLGKKPLGDMAKDLEAVDKQLRKHESITFEVGRIASLDVFATAASATLLYIGSKFFARQNERRAHEKKEITLKTPQTPQREEEAVVPKDTPAEGKAFAERVEKARTEQPQQPAI